MVSSAGKKLSVSEMRWQRIEGQLNLKRTRLIAVRVLVADITPSVMLMPGRAVNSDNLRTTSRTTVVATRRRRAGLLICYSHKPSTDRTCALNVGQRSQVWLSYVATLVTKRNCANQSRLPAPIRLPGPLRSNKRDDIRHHAIGMRVRQGVRGILVDQQLAAGDEFVSRASV